MRNTETPTNNTKREIYLPGPEAPHWKSPGEAPGGLFYLAWGHRAYGKNPIPQRLHHGWTYMAVLSGSPVLLIGSRKLTAGSGHLIVTGPDVPYGWNDRASTSCSILVWEWSRAPEFQIPVTRDSWWTHKSSMAALQNIQQIHVRTRHEIQNSDSRSPRVLEALHSLLDAEFERAVGEAEDQKSRDDQRLNLAEAWMRHHLDIRAPARALAEYLGISTMTLHRLFRETTGMSTGRAFLDLKLNEAVKMLEKPSISVKEVAHSLGYRHHGDFTRAYKKKFGRTPVNQLRKS